MKSPQWFVAIAILVVYAAATFPDREPWIPPAAFAQASNLTAFSQDFAEITPGSSVLARQPRALFICDADGGDIDVTPWSTPNAMPITLPVSGGAIYPISPGKVLSSSTADCIVALY